MLHTPSHSSPKCTPPSPVCPPVPTCLPEGRVLLKALRVLRVPLPRPLIKQVEVRTSPASSVPSLHSASHHQDPDLLGIFSFSFSLSISFLSLFLSLPVSFPFAVHLLFLRVCSHPFSTASSSQLCCHINVTPALPLSLTECSTAVSRPLRPAAPHHPPLKTTTTPPR